MWDILGLGMFEVISRGWVQGLEFQASFSLSVSGDWSLRVF